jgi:hypothetical protein
MLPESAPSLAVAVSTVSCPSSTLGADVRQRLKIGDNHRERRPFVDTNVRMEAASWALPRLHQLHLSGSLFGEPLFDYPQQRP